MRTPTAGVPSVPPPSGPRRLCLGVPLMQGLNEAQLRAVLAHELGHYSNSDTP
jgi:Zn-dependent protease with chaperone function